MDIESIRGEFEEAYSRTAVGAAQAPGRVNLIGEHTDYNDGFVLPIAIERRTLALYAPRDDGEVHFTSLQAQARDTIDLHEPIDRATGETSWANYCRGVAAGLLQADIELRGADVLFAADVPLGGGLSSSASLEVATAGALLAAAGKLGALSDAELARICQQAEHEYAGAPCGIMDQSIAIMAQPGKALLLDCRSGRTLQIPFDDPRAVVLVVDTRVKHDIADGGYAARRSQCEQAAKTLHVPALRDADDELLSRATQAGRLGGKELMRARHVVGEIARTLAAVDALQARDYRRFGELMYASHASLRDDYDVSCEELDAVVELSQGCRGVYGARMTGGGFGGCAIVLAEAEQADNIARIVTKGFIERFSRPCAIFATRAAGGAGAVSFQ